MSKTPNPIEFIRKRLFAVTQAEFAEIAGASQALVSRWENGFSHPDSENMRLIRAAAVARGLVWNDSLFFEAPTAQPSEVA